MPDRLIHYGVDQIEQPEEGFDFDSVCFALERRLGLLEGSARKIILDAAMKRDFFLDSHTVAGAPSRKQNPELVLPRLNSLKFWIIENGGNFVLEWKAPDALSSRKICIEIHEYDQPKQGQDLTALFLSGVAPALERVREMRLASPTLVKAERGRKQKSLTEDAEAHRETRNAIKAALSGDDVD